MVWLDYLNAAAMPSPAPTGDRHSSDNRRSRGLTAKHTRGTASLAYELEPQNDCSRTGGDVENGITDVRMTPSSE